MRIVEAYPAAALAMWSVPRQGYKSEDGRAVREAMLGRIEESGPTRWLAWSSDARATCAATDHALDALVCALVARAAALGLLHAVDADCADAARAEGWIALPTAASLGALVGGA